jgi:hypothetical protein
VVDDGEKVMVSGQGSLDLVRSGGSGMYGRSWS